MSQRRRKGFLAGIRRALQRIGIPRDASLLVALSGGPDSVALLHALVELRGEFSLLLAAGHLNHGLRGEESDRDESFCRDLCERMNIDLIVERATSLSPGMANLEEAARDVRRDFLNRAADRIGADFIALGHHAGDQAETVLMRLLRGAGTAGLSAMAERGPGRVIRPMLSLSRRDILDYLDAVGARYVSDASNETESILRNRLRHQLLPPCRDYVPGYREGCGAGHRDAGCRFFSTRCIGRAADAQLRSKTGPASICDPRWLCARPFAPVPDSGDGQSAPCGLIILSWQTCVQGPANGEVTLPHKWRAVREYDILFVVLNRVQEAAPRFAVPLSFEGATIVDEAGYAFDSKVVGPAESRMPGDHWSAIFDAELVGRGDFIARNLKAGDRVRPLGLNGTRKVKDVLIDRKMPPGERARLPIVILNDVILWLPGVMRAEGVLVRSSTESVPRRGPQDFRLRGTIAQELNSVIRFL